MRHHIEQAIDIEGLGHHRHVQAREQCTQGQRQREGVCGEQYKAMVLRQHTVACHRPQHARTV